MSHGRCARRHWLRYVVGLKEPPIERTGQGYLGAIARGQIVHDVLEGLQEDADFDALLEAAIGKWDDSAAPPDSAAGRDLREMLREEIRLVADHPDYRTVAENPTNRRELPFVHLVGADRHLQGMFDLAACESDGLVLLDVKTAQGDAAHAAEVAGRYDLQRSAYVTAAESIGGIPVSRFAFQFSRAETQISTPVGPAEREQARRQVEEAFAAIDAGAAGLTALSEGVRVLRVQAGGVVSRRQRRGGVMAAPKLQRWIDLLAALLRRRYAVPFEELAQEVPGYQPGKQSKAALRRMFERDKDELRAFGVPIETVLSPEGEAEGYRLVAKEFYLPYLSMVVEGRKTAPKRVDRYGYKALAGLAFEPDELAAVAEAAVRVRALGVPELAALAESACRKLAFDLPVDAARAAEVQVAGRRREARRDLRCAGRSAWSDGSGSPSPIARWVVTTWRSAPWNRWASSSWAGTGTWRHARRERNWSRTSA